MEHHVAMVPLNVLLHGVMQSLVLLVFDLHGDDGKAVQEEGEIGPLPLLDYQFIFEIQTVLSVPENGCTLASPRLRVIELELQATNFQTAADDDPQGRMVRFILECPEYFNPRIRAVVFFEGFKGVGLGGLDEGDEVILGEIMFGVGDLRLFQHGILVHPLQVLRDMPLKLLFRAWEHNLLSSIGSFPS